MGKLYLFQIPTDWHPRVVIPASSPIRPRLASQLCHLGGCGISPSWQGDVPVRGDKQDPPWEACEDDSRYGQSREAQSLCFPAVWPGHNLSAFLTLLLPEKIGVTGLKTSSVVKMTCGCAPRVQLTVWQSQCCGNRRLLLSRGCLRWAGPLRSASVRNNLFPCQTNMSRVSQLNSLTRPIHYQVENEGRLMLLTSYPMALR